MKTLIQLGSIRRDTKSLPFPALDSGDGAKIRGLKDGVVVVVDCAANVGEVSKWEQLEQCA